MTVTTCGPDSLVRRGVNIEMGLSNETNIQDTPDKTELRIAYSHILALTKLLATYRAPTFPPSLVANSNASRKTGISKHHPNLIHEESKTHHLPPLISGMDPNVPGEPFLLR